MRWAGAAFVALTLRTDAVSGRRVVGVRFELRSPKLAVVGLALLLFAIVFGLEANGPAGGVALVIALVGLVLVILA